MTATGLFLAASMVAAMPQQADPPRFSEAQFTPAPLKVDMPSPQPVAATPAVEVEAEAAEEEVASRRLTWRTLLHRVGGALVGGWVGYVGAQVAKSDWDKETNGSFRDQRSTWAAAGAVLGVFGSRLIGSTRAPGKAIRIESPRSDPFYLGTEEIREALARDAYELIRNTRMHWLVTRGANSVAETARGEARGDFDIRVTPGRDKIIVYMDDVRLGGVDAMRDVPVDGLTSARFLDAREATLRYGTGHAHGAIALSTAIRQ